MISNNKWTLTAACKDETTNIFFTNQYDYVALKKARSICSTCPVSETCLETALGYGYSLEGIWAGTTRRQRKKILRTRNAQVHVNG